MRLQVGSIRLLFCELHGADETVARPDVLHAMHG
jgi:hypothetical protein